MACTPCCSLLLNNPCVAHARNRAHDSSTTECATTTPLQAFSTCTLKDLCPEDKQKVAQLVKQVVELGKENAQLKGAHATTVS